MPDCWLSSFLTKAKSRSPGQGKALQTISEGIVADRKLSRNAGLFIWLDLGHFLPLSETGGDGWAAARLLDDRLQRDGGIIMSTGEAYRAETPGRFRLVFSMPEATVREGIRRYS